MSRFQMEPGRRIFWGASILFFVLLFLSGRALAGAVWSFPLFQVRALEIRWPAGMPAAPERFRVVPPTSIFSIHLSAVRRTLEERFPTSEVRQVERIFPNRVVARMRPRTVIAQVRAGDRYFPVSDEGMVVAPGRPGLWPRLPVLFLERVEGSWEVGGLLRAPGFWAASELLSAINRQGGIRGHRVMTLKVQGKNLMVFLNSGLEIRFAEEDLATEWQRLWELVAQRWEMLQRARYVDLRFEDPVIGG